MACLLTQPLAILAVCLQYSQTDQNSICSLAIFFLSERDRRVTRGKANKDTAETKEAFSCCFDHL